MNLLKSVAYGFVYFAIMFVLGSIVMFGLKLSGTSMSLSMTLLAILMLWLLAKQYKLMSLNEGIMVGLVWCIVNVVLEYSIIVQIFNSGNGLAFYSWSVLLGYLLAVIVPAVVGTRATK